MSSTPQCPIEEIELTPLHIDVWRTALNALIAVAPGSTYDVAWHLADAREKTLVCRDFSAATQGEAMLIDRLMLLAAGKRAGQAQRSHNAFGFTHQAPLIGIDLSASGSHGPRPVAQPGAASSAAHEAPEAPLASSRSASSVQAPRDQSLPAFPSPQPGTAKPEQGHESAPRSAAGEPLQRPLGDSSCQ